MLRGLIALGVISVVCAASSTGVAAQSSDGTDVPVIPPVQRGGLFRNVTPQTAIDLARNNAARTTGLSVDQVSVVSVQSVEWPDFSLGCASLEPHMVFAQIVTPGYVIQLDAAGTPMTFHTDAGLRAIQCDDSPTPVAT